MTSEICVVSFYKGQQVLPILLITSDIVFLMTLRQDIAKDSGAEMHGRWRQDMSMTCCVRYAKNTAGSVKFAVKAEET